MVRTHTKIGGGIAPGVSPNGAKTCLVFSVSCTDFDHFGNKRRESVCACVHWWKEFPNFCVWVSRPPKQQKWVISRAVLVIGYSSNCTISGDGDRYFWGLYDIQKMCLCESVLVRDIQFGRYEARKTPISAIWSFSSCLPFTVQRHSQGSSRPLWAHTPCLKKRHWCCTL